MLVTMLLAAVADFNGDIFTGLAVGVPGNPEAGDRFAAALAA